MVVSSSTFADERVLRADVGFGSSFFAERVALLAGFSSSSFSSSSSSPLSRLLDFFSFDGLADLLSTGAVVLLAVVVSALVSSLVVVSGFSSATGSKDAINDKNGFLATTLTTLRLSIRKSELGIQDREANILSSQ